MANARRVALLFPGQGSQYPRMAAALYGHAPVFSATMDQAFCLLGDQGATIRDDWLAERPTPLFDDVTRAQPLLYAIDVSLGAMVLDWGVEPAAMLGHSVGELAAATLAGVLTFAEGMALMRDRARYYADTPPGGMLAVAATVEDVTPFLTGRVFIAAVNSRQQTMIAGERDDLAAVRRALSAANFTCLRARAHQAFHTPLVADAAARSLDGWRSVRLTRPRRLVYSSHLAAVLDAEHATDPVFWALQPTKPVLFWPTLELLLAGNQALLLVEAGPGEGLATIARRHPALMSGRCSAIALLPGRSASADAERALVRSVAELIAGESHASESQSVAIS
jgi:[acyl-carrier-protein] S-malonyltransferase